MLKFDTLEPKVGGDHLTIKNIHFFLKKILKYEAVRWQFRPFFNHFQKVEKALKMDQNGNELTIFF